ncbi:MAG: Inner membrane protein YbiR [Spirochaetes bacterium ADurb.Bin218]|nr:MAG: Inner membrane protein YbiR [Spirochaetes bacterium ADurb.Bin218]HPD76997.1 anion transporter [Spirochaetota bacterium]
MLSAATIIFIITYSGIIFTRLPWVNVDRPSAAFFGAVSMILFGILSFDEAIAAIDFNTISLLIGMMIIITVLELDGFFAFVAYQTIKFAKNEKSLLLIIIFTTGISSAFLVNDAVVLLYTPIVISICRNSNINPVPYLIAEILASNAGSAMTITGNPQNMLIGISSGIHYGKFMLHLAPISILSMLAIYLVIKILYKENFKGSKTIKCDINLYKFNYASMKFSVPIFILVIGLFFTGKILGLSIPLIALVGASLILLLGKIKPSVVISRVDWVLIIFFASLFIVVRGFETSGIIEHIVANWPISNDLKGITILHGISLILSQIISNVPFTIVMLPILKNSAGDLIWLSLASASTLAGNATILGAMANLIVIESAEKLKVKISFFEFLKPGLIVTFLSLIISTVILYIELLIFG